MPAYSREVRIPGKSAAELYEVVSRDIDALVKNISGSIAHIKFKIHREPSAHRLKLESAPVSATLSCSAERLKLEGKIGLLVLPFRTQIDRGIDRWLNKTFPEHQS